MYCTEECQDDNDCPQGAACFDVGQINVCAWLEGEGNEEPMGATASYGETCDAPSDCIEQLCLSDGMTQFCSRYCSVASDCPDGDLCVGIGNGQGGCLPGSAEDNSEAGTEAGSEAGDSSNMSGANPDDAGSSMSIAGDESGETNPPFEPPSTELEGGGVDSELESTGTTLSASCQAQSTSGGSTPLILLLLLACVARVVRREELR